MGYTETERGGGEKEGQTDRQAETESERQRDTDTDRNRERLSDTKHSPTDCGLGLRQFPGCVRWENHSGANTGFDYLVIFCSSLVQSNNDIWRLLGKYPPLLPEQPESFDEAIWGSFCFYFCPVAFQALEGWG